jgi:hypothetical protein
MTLRDDHLRVPLSRGTIVLPHGSCEALVARLHRYDAMRDVREALERVEPPEGVPLTAAQKAFLIRVIDEWATDGDGRGEPLPPGILELRDGLLEDLTGPS